MRGKRTGHQKKNLNFAKAEMSCTRSFSKGVLRVLGFCIIIIICGHHGRDENSSFDQFQLAFTAAQFPTELRMRIGSACYVRLNHWIDLSCNSRRPWTPLSIFG